MNVFAHTTRIATVYHELQDMGFECLATAGPEDCALELPVIERQMDAAKRGLRLLQDIDPVAYDDALAIVEAKFFA